MMNQETGKENAAGKHPLRVMLEKRARGEKIGIPSYCSSNPYVLETALLRAKEHDTPVLIEATANQVNQFGGYSGMNPADFRAFIRNIAAKLGVDEKLILLGGDHLGPLTWSAEPEASAMEKAEGLVAAFAEAGFSKIHLDTSMKLGDDPEHTKLDTEVIARRGARLYRAAMSGFERLKKKEPDALRPVFVIGSEVPVPGGAREEEDTIRVTEPETFRETVQTYTRVFSEECSPEARKDVIAVVVQPGVEFGDDQIFYYDRRNSAKLCACLKDEQDIVFEGHSTDYQSRECLRSMVEDGIAILKVGPALTFGLREALFALEKMEKILLPEDRGSRFADTLDRAMLADPVNWENYYHGTEAEKAVARKYSLSDRCRYYLGEETVQRAIDRLLANMAGVDIPMGVLHQYMPKQYDKITAGKLTKEPVALIRDGIARYMEDYEYAAYGSAF